MPEIEIIDKPKLKNFLRNTTEWSFTTLIWGLWLYLFLPLLDIILWWLGIGSFYVEVIEKAGYIYLVDLLAKMGWCILLVFGILRLWGYYNYWKFGKKNRRKQLSSYTNEQLSELFHIPAEQIVELQSKKELVWPIR